MKQPRYQVTTKVPYFNHTKDFESFDEAQAWVQNALGIVLLGPGTAAVHPRGTVTLLDREKASNVRHRKP